MMILCLILLVCCVRCHTAQFCDLFALASTWGDTRQHNIGYYIYADGTQLYISSQCKYPLESLTKLNMCISDIRVLIIKKKLKINDSKTEFIIIRSPLLKQKLSLSV